MPKDGLVATIILTTCLSRRRLSASIPVLLLVLALTIGPPTTAQISSTPDQSLSQLNHQLEDKLLELQKQNSFPGATLGFVLPDGRSGSLAVGLADRERKVP